MNATSSARARQRATHSRLRAFVKVPGQRYEVKNLTNHKVYVVWWNTHRDAWECTCQTNNLKQRCKHVQRVMDREETRIRKEALAEEAQQEADAERGMYRATTIHAESYANED